MNKNDKSLFENIYPLPKDETELLEWIQKNQGIVDIWFDTEPKESNDVHSSASSINDNAKWSAGKTVQIVKDYIRREPNCTLIIIKSWTNGVPDVFDCTGSAEGKLVFSDGFLNGYIDPAGYKADIEMETLFADAAMEDQSSKFIELLVSYTEQLFRADNTFAVTRSDIILYLQVV